MRFIKSINSIFKGRIIYISDNKVVNYTIGPFTFLAFFFVISSFLAFGLYLFGFKIASSAFLSKKEFEIKKYKSINLALSKKLESVISDVDLFNNYLYYIRSSPQENESLTRFNNISICNNNDQINNLRYQDNLKLQNSSDAKQNTYNQEYKMVSYEKRIGLAGINTKSDLIEKMLELDKKILLSRNFINNAIITKLNQITTLDNENIDTKYIKFLIHQENESISTDYTKLNHLTSIFENMQLNNSFNNIDNHYDDNFLYQNIFNQIYNSNSTNCNFLECQKDNLILEKISTLKNLQSKIKSLPLGRPIDFTRVTSAYGARIDPQKHILSFHHGIDIVANKNERVKSVSDGVVIAAGVFSGYGNYIEINHGNGIKTGYAHLKKILVKTGDKINKGDVIGIQGSTGKSTADHLHYEIKIKNQRKNPITFLKNNQQDEIIS